MVEAVSRRSMFGLFAGAPLAVLAPASAHAVVIGIDAGAVDDLVHFGEWKVGATPIYTRAYWESLPQTRFVRDRLARMDADEAAGRLTREAPLQLQAPTHRSPGPSSQSGGSSSPASAAPASPDCGPCASALSSRAPVEPDDLRDLSPPNSPVGVGTTGNGESGAVHNTASDLHTANSGGGANG